MAKVLKSKSTPWSALAGVAPRSVRAHIHAHAGVSVLRKVFYPIKVHMEPAYQLSWVAHEL